MSQEPEKICGSEKGMEGGGNSPERIIYHPLAGSEAGDVDCRQE